jgi:hypothetical protein
VNRPRHHGPGVAIRGTQNLTALHTSARQQRRTHGRPVVAAPLLVDPGCSAKPRCTLNRCLASARISSSLKERLAMRKSSKRPAK